MTKENNCNILLTSVGRRVELLNAFIKCSNEENGLNIEVITTDHCPQLSAACQMSKKSFSISKCDDPNYIKDLLAICIKNKIKLVIPTIDTELVPLSLAREEFEKKGINIIISDLEFVKSCRDKRLMNNIFKNIGLKFPTSYNSQNIKYPCFVKPYDGSSSIGTKVINSEKDISLSDLNNPKNIFQEYLDKNWNEYTIDMYYDTNSNLCACVPRERLETRGGEISKGIPRRNYVYDFIIDKLKFIKGARGPVTIQLFFNPTNKEIFAIEINPRFGGGYPMSHASGVNFPLMLIKEYILKNSISFSDQWEPNSIMLRYDEMIINKKAI